MRNLLAYCTAIILTAFSVQAEEKRIITIGSSLTEIVFALGLQDQLVGRDRSSTYPADALELPDIGYRRALSPEGVLSVAPTLILSLEGSGPPKTIAVLQEAGVEHVTIPDEFSRDGIVEKILAVGAALGVEAEAQTLANRVARQLDEAQNEAILTAGAAPVRVLFILSAQDGEITVGGSDTQADSIIRMAGGTNAASDFKGFKTLTPEALATTSPDVILMMERRGDHVTSETDLLTLPAMKLTPAGRANAIIRMPGTYLLGFGPRTADAIQDLSTALQGIKGS